MRAGSGWAPGVLKGGAQGPAGRHPLTAGQHRGQLAAAHEAPGTPDLCWPALRLRELGRSHGRAGLGSTVPGGTPARNRKILDIGYRLERYSGRRHLGLHGVIVAALGARRNGASLLCHASSANCYQ